MPFVWVISMFSWLNWATVLAEHRSPSAPTLCCHKCPLSNPSVNRPLPLTSLPINLISSAIFYPLLGSPCGFNKKTLVSHKHFSGNTNNSLTSPRQHMFFVVGTFILADSSVSIFATWLKMLLTFPLCQRLASLLIVVLVPIV